MTKAFMSDPGSEAYRQFHTMGHEWPTVSGQVAKEEARRILAETEGSYDEVEWASLSFRREWRNGVAVGLDEHGAALAESLAAWLES